MRCQWKGRPAQNARFLPSCVEVGGIPDPLVSEKLNGGKVCNAGSLSAREAANAPRGGVNAVAVARPESELERLSREICALDQERMPGPDRTAGGKRSPAAIEEYLAHYHGERNHQGLGNVLLRGSPDPANENDECNGASGSAAC